MTEPIKKNKKVILPDDPKNIEWYNFIYSMLESNEIALVGKCTVKLKDNEGIYRLTLHKDNILLSRQVFPEDLREFDNFRSFEGRMEKVTPQFVEKATKIGKQAIKRGAWVVGIIGHGGPLPISHLPIGLILDK